MNIFFCSFNFSKNNNNIDYKEFKFQTPISSRYKHKIEINYNNLNKNIDFLNKKTFINNTNYKINNPIKSQINRIKLFRNNSLKELHILSQNEHFNLMNNKRSNNINKINQKNLYKKVFQNSSQNIFFKIKNINKIILKKTILNKRIIPNFNSHKNSLNYCDASTNTHYENNNNLGNQKINLYNKLRRPLMIDYFESEHKKFCHGFDKYKGKNRYKIPFFIVYKY